MQIVTIIPLKANSYTTSIYTLNIGNQNSIEYKKMHINVHLTTSVNIFNLKMVPIFIFLQNNFKLYTKIVFLKKYIRIIKNFCGNTPFIFSQQVHQTDTPPVRTDRSTLILATCCSV